MKLLEDSFSNPHWERIKKNTPSTNATRRVYGITNQTKAGTWTALAYRAHSGIDWKDDSPAKQEKNFKTQLGGGRALEVLTCESLILGKFPGFHFLPPRELDLHYKIDLISRMPYVGLSKVGTKLKTFAIGSQLTLMELPENIYGTHRDANMKRAKYRDKIDQVRNMTEFLHNPESRKDIKGRFGKLTLPDIMCFVAVNGKPRKTLGNTSNYMYMKFSEWSAAGYPDTGTISQFKPRLRNTILDVASFISETQEYIFSNEFLFKNGANKGKGSKKEADSRRKIFDFDSHSSELSCYLYNHDNLELLVKVTYLFRPGDIAKLASKRRNTNRYQHDKNIPPQTQTLLTGP